MSIQPFIKCSDITTSLHFYSNILDFNVLKHPDPDPSAFMSKYALLERGGDLLHLSAHAGDGVYGNVIYIQVKNVDALYDTFVDNGLCILVGGYNSCISMTLVEQTWGMKEFSVIDPDGNRLTFGQPIH